MWWQLLITGAILFSPFYVFLVFLYVRISYWERFIQRWVEDPAHRDHVQKMINLGENVVYNRVIPMFADKLEHAFGIVDQITRRFGLAAQPR